MKLQLNFDKPGNYAFFCPVSKVHLTRSNPVAFVNEVTPYIKRGIKSKSIIEIVDNGATGQKTNEPVDSLKNEVTEPLVSQEESTESTVAEPVVEETTEEAPVEEKKETSEEKPTKGKRGRKGSNSEK